MQDQINRRVFLGGSGGGLGFAALASLMKPVIASDATVANARFAPHFPPKAKRIIYLFQSGAPSQMDLFDPKPQMEKYRGEDLPDSIRKGQRLTTMTSGQKSFPVAPSMFSFAQHGQSGMWFSELVPNMARHADRWCMIRSMHTEQINHDPAITFFQTGFQLAGRPSIGSWVSYGLGALNRNLPSYVVLTSLGNRGAQPLYSRLWASGFLPTEHSGVKLRNTGAPVFYLSDPPGIDRPLRRDILDDLASLNREQLAVTGAPETEARIAQYEMAFRMQSSVPALMDFSDETKDTLDLYGTKGTDGSFASNCLQARRLAERGVRFIQLYHRGWDHHGNVKGASAGTAKLVDQGAAALIKDLKQRDMLKDTLVVMACEFGRTPMAQGSGRDHHIKGFSMWMAGGGIKPGTTYGATDELGYNAVDNVVTVHDMHATLLKTLGIDHKKLTVRFQGRDFRLTDVHGDPIEAVLA